MRYAAWHWLLLSSACRGRWIYKYGSGDMYINYSRCFSLTSFFTTSHDSPSSTLSSSISSTFVSVSSCSFCFSHHGFSFFYAPFVLLSSLSTLFLSLLSTPFLFVILLLMCISSLFAPHLDLSPVGPRGVETGPLPDSPLWQFSGDEWLWGGVHKLWPPTGQWHWCCDNLCLSQASSECHLPHSHDRRGSLWQPRGHLGPPRWPQRQPDPRFCH